MAEVAATALSVADPVLGLALDMASRSRADLRDLLRTWSKAEALMAAGQAIGRVETGSQRAGDTGEALGLRPASLTMTFGFGPSLFGNGARPRSSICRLFVPTRCEHRSAAET